MVEYKRDMVITHEIDRSQSIDVEAKTRDYSVYLTVQDRLDPLDRGQLIKTQFEAAADMDDERVVEHALKIINAVRKKEEDGRRFNLNFGAYWAQVHSLLEQTIGGPLIHQDIAPSIEEHLERWVPPPYSYSWSVEANTEDKRWDIKLEAQHCEFCDQTPCQDHLICGVKSRCAQDDKLAEQIDPIVLPHYTTEQLPTLIELLKQGIAEEELKIAPMRVQLRMIQDMYAGRLFPQLFEGKPQ